MTAPGNAVSNALHLSTSYVRMPWHYDSGLRNCRGWAHPKGHFYGRIELRHRSPEWNAALALFVATSNGRYRVTKIDLVHNRNMQRVFEGNCTVLEQRSKQPVFQPAWRSEDKVAHRQAIIDRLNGFAKKHTRTDWPYKGVRAVPLFHGCGEAAVCRYVD